MNKDNDSSSRVCPGKIEVPTEKEREALAAMKSIKERVREIKSRLTSLRDSSNDEGGQEALSLNEELTRLKAEWEEWEKRREEAQRERMILLGHEEP